MAVSGYLEIITTLIGWKLYGVIWNVFVSTGVAMVPFIVILLRNLIKARETRSQTDVGIVALRLSEIHIYMAIVIILIACQPMVQIHARDVAYVTNSCDVPDAERDQTSKSIGETGTTFDTASGLITLNDETIAVPIWWVFTNNVFRGITAEIIDQIPCTLNVTRAMSEAQGMAIDDEVLLQEAVQFGRECYVPAYNRYKSDPVSAFDLERRGYYGLKGGFNGIGRVVRLDVSWFGSRILNQHAGFFDVGQAATPVSSFEYDLTRDDGSQDPEYQEGGYPMCTQWWSSLLPRLAEEGGSYTRTPAWQLFSQRWFESSGYNAQETIAAYVLGGDQAGTATSKALSTSFSSNGNGAAMFFQDMASWAGLNVLAAGHYTKMRLVRDAAPMMQALLMMLLTIVLPIAIIFTLYEIKTIFIFTFVQFGVIFWSFLYALAFWLDNTLAEVFLSDTSPIRTAVDEGNRIRTDLLEYISASLHLMLPVGFGLIMGWAGVKAGNQAADYANESAKNAAGTGEKGAQIVQAAAKTVVTKGAG